MNTPEDPEAVIYRKIRMSPKMRSALGELGLQLGTQSLAETVRMVIALHALRTLPDRTLVSQWRQQIRSAAEACRDPKPRQPLAIGITGVTDNLLSAFAEEGESPSATMRRVLVDATDTLAELSVVD